MPSRPGSVFDRFRPQSSGLSVWLSLSYGVLAIGLVGVLSVFVERAATSKLEGDVGLRLASHARALATRMDDGLHERLNDLRVLSLIPAVKDPAAKRAALLEVFGMMQAGFPDYMWIGLTDAAGRVQVAGDGLLEGEDFSEREWFQAAREAPFVGEVREAKLLTTLLPAPVEGPLLVVDVATPIHDESGALVGVLAAHLSWQWAESLRQDLIRPLMAKYPVDVFVLDREGVVVLGPMTWRQQSLDMPSARLARAGQSGAVMETWPDGVKYLTGYAPTQGGDPLQGHGWTVLVRKEAALAFDTVAELRRQIWLTAVLSTLAFLLVATVMARLIGAPLLALANAARRIQARDPEATFPPARGYREARELTGALRGLVEDLTTHERELTVMTQELERRVRERTLELSEANAQLEVLAMTDSLTGLANRRHFGDQLAREVTRAAELGKPVALVTVDIDHFKAVNDQYGHPAGDAVLRRVAMLLEEQVRGSDLLARVGGEEFSVLAVEAAVAEASQMGERLRAAVEKAGPISIGRAALQVTVSVGVSVVWPRPGDLLKVPERLLAGADDALYRAKRNGRNRVEVAAP